MKRYFICILAAVALASCLREPVPESADDGLVEKTWTVSIDAGTRGTLDETLYPVWEVGEKLSVYDPVVQTGRVFTVNEVNGHTAVISGRISEGDFPFDAIYPSKSAGAWASDGTNRAKLPATQIIPAGRDICPDVLVATAHSEHPDEGVLFHNAVSLLRFRIDKTLSTVSFDLAGETPKQYTAAAADILSPGDYYLAVDPGAFTGLTVSAATGFDYEYIKASSTPLEAVQNKILDLGLVSDGKVWRSYAVSGEKRYANQQALIDETGLLDGLSGFLAALANAALTSAFPDRSQAVRAFNITHPSADPQGRSVTLSARIYIPEAALNGEKALEGIALANHGTIASNAECPTMASSFEALFTWKNYAVIMPDYYGFGASKDRPQAFLDPETTARGNLDAYFSTLQFLEDRGVTAGSVRFNYGYSQGGFNTLANLRYLTQHPEMDLRFTKSFAGGGPYDVPATWASYLDGSFSNALAFIPLTLVSFNESRQLGLDYATLFKGALLANWQEWILSKKYSVTSIGTKLGKVGIADILADDMVSGQGAAYATVMEVCRQCSLNSGWRPRAGEKILIFHSTGDDIVPFANYTSIKNYFDEVAPDCEITWDKGSYGDHVTACIYYILKLLTEWKP